MEVAHNRESQNDRDSDTCHQETRSESLSWINETGAVQLKAEETKQNDVRAIWVKWRGKWQPGIQCSIDDCPSATLKGKPTSERKNYIVVYFPHSRSHCWADSQLICPITEKPEPLAYGTHESGFGLVEDLQTPRRYMMQSLAVAMFDISDQLHIETVVESARDVNVWREFAREAGRCKNYSDIGRMLVKLQSMILEVFISPKWTKNSFDLWKQQCENAQNTESIEVLTKEGYLVYECNSMCSCNKECPNRVLQKGVQVKIEVYKTKQKGWAVRAAQTISRGTFICEYLGEVLNDQEANKRGERYDNEGCSYLYDIDAHIDASDLGDGVQPYVIDATKYGNVARFINHSCLPNLVNYQVLVESMDCQLAHIGLYASRDIAIGEELAYDYRYKLLPGKGCPCHCGASNCRGRLY